MLEFFLVGCLIIGGIITGAKLLDGRRDSVLCKHYEGKTLGYVPCEEKHTPKQEK